MTLKYIRKGRGGKREQTIHLKFPIPVAYHQLVYQLMSEIDLADDHNVHEAYNLLNLSQLMKQSTIFNLVYLLELSTLVISLSKE